MIALSTAKPAGQPHLSHAEPWAHNYICCDVDHAASTSSSPRSAPPTLQAHNHTHDCDHDHDRAHAHAHDYHHHAPGHAHSHSLAHAHVPAHARSQSTQLPYQLAFAHVHAQTQSKSQSQSQSLPQTPIVPSQPGSATTTPCPLDFTALCCADEVCAEGKEAVLECCEDPHCEETAELICCDADHGDGDGHCGPPEACAASCGLNDVHGLGFGDLVGSTGTTPGLNAEETQEERDLKELERWACTKEGCHAIQQYLDCCSAENCTLPSCTHSHPAPVICQHGAQASLPHDITTTTTNTPIQDTPSQSQFPFPTGQLYPAQSGREQVQSHTQTQSQAQTQHHQHLQYQHSSHLPSSESRSSLNLMPDLHGPVANGHSASTQLLPESRMQSDSFSSSFDTPQFPSVQWSQQSATSTFGNGNNSGNNQSSVTTALHPSALAHPTMNVCHWQNCHRTFGDTPSLLAHIASDHLGAGLGQGAGTNTNGVSSTLPSHSQQPHLALATNGSGSGGQSHDQNQIVPPNSTQDNPSFDLSGFNIDTTNYDPLLSCLWDDCLPVVNNPPMTFDAGSNGLLEMHNQQFVPQAAGVDQQHAHAQFHLSTQDQNRATNNGQILSQAGLVLQGQAQAQNISSQFGFNLGHNHLQSHTHSVPHSHAHNHVHTSSNGEPFSPQTMLRHVLEEHLGLTTTNLNLDLNALLPPAPVSTPVISSADAFQKPKAMVTPRQTPNGSNGATKRKYQHQHQQQHPHPHPSQHNHSHNHNSHNQHPQPILPTPSPSTYTASPPPGPTSSRAETASSGSSHGYPPSASAVNKIKDLVCQWPECTHTAPFPDSAALMDHLSECHIGKCKTTYTCLWGACGEVDSETGGRGREFKSRQKVLRHLQSHTGHKPFVCEVCDQAFSEAAPLQAHMRRHAQEKPFKCEYPGCGKTFAISSSLTIHMRTHNGEKPFICPHCDKGFVEASNLTKHIRTHTGERPFACSYPGCEKRFPRPDQLKRHMGVHDADRPGRGRRGRRESKLVVEG